MGVQRNYNEPAGVHGNLLANTGDTVTFETRRAASEDREKHVAGRIHVNNVTLNAVGQVQPLEWYTLIDLRKAAAYRERIDFVELVNQFDKLQFLDGNQEDFAAIRKAITTSFWPLDLWMEPFDLGPAGEDNSPS